ncbi:molecular chaperone [Acinetobacter rudis]|uniref:molecular chaperone n=1 Tax=Acinetobacter rudis TaxID=632955 RepID=UPI00333E57DC
MSKQFLNKICLMLMLFGTANMASAVYFSSYIYEMGSDESFISKPVKNDTSVLNLYTVQSFKIDQPGDKGENIIYAKDREIIYTPVKLQIAANSTDFFKLLYIGPKDDQERYYRVVFTEIPLAAFAEQEHGKATSFMPTVSMSTIMVVRPRKQKLQYVIDEKQGIIKNTGNTFFRVIIHQRCRLNDESSTQFYMLPGEEYKNDVVKQKNQKFIVANKRYIAVGDQCPEQVLDEEEGPA